ncbi:MAG: diacylglycerol kinase family lipid kinase [Acidobacteria bacterium]|nr:diacylglycerol kinase family lipid kinase [Acidobacteriota bacterium]
MKETFLAVINPAAGAGRCGKLAPAALDELRKAGVSIESAESRAPGDASRLVREAYRLGYRKFIAVGGDGTSYEIVNGLYPEVNASGTPEDRPVLAFLPLGTGNSFLRDFTDRGEEHAKQSLLAGRKRPCDVLRLQHRDGVLHYMNLLSVGFTADVATLTNRRFKQLGEFGYLLGILVCLIRMNRRAFPLRVDQQRELDRRPCLFLTFNNSQFTGGKMRIAPQANSGDGLIEFVRWGPIGRLGLLANLHRLYDGSHVNHPLASRQAVKRIEFELDEPVDIMVDGEVLRAHCQLLEILPAAMQVMV